MPYKPSSWVCKPALIGACLKPEQIGMVAAGRASGVKMGDDGGGAPIVRMGVASRWIAGASASVIFPWTIKSRRWRATERMGITLWAPTHAYTNRRWGNPVRMQHNALLGHSIVFMMIIRLITCRKAGDIRSVPGMWTHWSGRVWVGECFFW